MGFLKTSSVLAWRPGDTVLGVFFVVISGGGVALDFFFGFGFVFYFVLFRERLL